MEPLRRSSAAAAPPQETQPSWGVVPDDAYAYQGCRYVTLRITLLTLRYLRYVELPAVLRLSADGRMGV